MPAIAAPSDQSAITSDAPPPRFEVPVQGAIRLGLHSRSAQWVLIAENQIWMIRGNQVPCVLAGHLPLTFLDGPEHRLRDDALGDVSMSPGGKLIFKHRDHAESPVCVPLGIPQPQPGFANWVEGMHRDGWVEVFGALSLEAIDRIGVRCYLPPIDGQGGKSLALRIGRHKLAPVTVERGNLSEFWFDLPEPSGELQFELSHIEPSTGATDRRLLGCVLAELSLDGTSWQPAKDFL